MLEIRSLLAWRGLSNEKRKKRKEGRKGSKKERKRSAERWRHGKLEGEGTEGRRKSYHGRVVGEQVGDTHVNWRAFNYRSHSFRYPRREKGDTALLLSLARRFPRSLLPSLPGSLPVAPSSLFLFLPLTRVCSFFGTLCRLSSLPLASVERG